MTDKSYRDIEIEVYCFGEGRYMLLDPELLASKQGLIKIHLVGREEILKQVLK